MHAIYGFSTINHKADTSFFAIKPARMHFLCYVIKIFIHCGMKMVKCKNLTFQRWLKNTEFEPPDAIVVGSLTINKITN